MQRLSYVALFLIVTSLFAAVSAAAASKVGWIAGGHISPLTLYRSDELAKVLESQRNAHFNTLFVTVKQFDGRIWYYSDEFANLMATPAPGFKYTREDNPLQKIIDASQQANPRQGVVALIQAFNDRYAARELFPEARIGRLDWVDPAYQPMQDYLIRIGVDLVKNYQIDGISLDMVRYPTGVSGTLPYTKSRDRVEVITEFVDKFTKAIKTVDQSIEVSANVFAGTVNGPVAAVGQDIKALSGKLDYVLPMLYPYDDNAGPSDDEEHYSYQLTSVRSALQQVQDPDFVKVDVQGFFGYDFGDVIAQIQGVRDAGGTGVMVYAYDFDMGWNPEEWAAVAAAMPDNWQRTRFRADQKAPQISKVTTMGNTLAWNTDELTTAQVRYGIFSLDNTVEMGWSKNHRVLLPLVAGIPYDYEITVVDRAGNTSVTSGQMTASAVPEQEAGILQFEISNVNDIWARLTWQTTIPTSAVIEVIWDGRREVTLNSFDTHHSFLLDGLHGDTTYQVRVFAIDGWGRKTLVEDTAIVTPRNLAEGGEATASSVVHKGFEAAKAVDGDIQTRWCSQYSDLEYFIVDLGQERLINGFGIEWEYAYAKSYKIRVSADGKEWQAIYENTNGNGGREDIAITPTSARYVQLVATERGTGLGYSIWEFKVF